MANQHGKWTDEYTEIAKRYILSGREFTIEEMMEHIPLTRITIGKYLVKTAKSMELVLKNATSKVPGVKVSVKEGVKPIVSEKHLEAKNRTTGSLQRFMGQIKIPREEEPMWMAITAASKEDARLKLASEVIMGKVLEIVTSEEYSKTRVRQTIKSRGTGQRNDMAYFAGKYQPR